MSEKKRLAVLGATGSVGRSTLDVVRELAHKFEITSLTAGSNVDLLQQQIAEFKPSLVAVSDREAAQKLKANLAGSSDAPQILSGKEGLIEAAVHPQVDFVVSAIVGAAGLMPTLAAIRTGKDIGLANKETLVMAGALITEAVANSGGAVRLLPIDSEHSAIFQVLQGEKRENVSCLILTASGGPFLNLAPPELAKVSIKEALNHPTWTMGEKITIDSATLMNKGLEVIEAYWLFGINHDKIEVVIHPGSVVHSLVEFIDGSLIAQLGVTDMRLPIAYALGYPERLANRIPRLDLTEVGTLRFAAPDTAKFPCLGLAYRSLQAGGSMPAVLNAANERAVEKFLRGEIAFTDIPRLIEKVMAAHTVLAKPDIEDILAIHRWARDKVDSDA